LLAISRCLAGSIAANPRFDPLLLVAAMTFSFSNGRVRNASAKQRFTMLIQVSELPFRRRKLPNLG